MRKNLKIPRLGLVLIAATLFYGISFAQTPSLDAKLNEQIVSVPLGSGIFGVELETTIFKPPGDGPFPLLIMNHGKAPGNAHFQERARYFAISREFVTRGYAVVIPMRKGFSKSTGAYVDGGCNIGGNGQAQADDVQGVLEYVVKQGWVDRERILVAGQSHGGLTTMAFGTRNFAGVKGLINFAGGLRKENCQWELSLVDAFGDFGAKTKLPSLWFYGENDSYFNPELANKMYAAYTKSGANAKLIAYGPFKNDAHSMSGSRDGVKIWWPETEQFLKKLGLPTEVLMQVGNVPQHPRTDFASIDNVDAIPYVKETGRAGYRNFLGRSMPRAFAISASGAWGWGNEGDEPSVRAMSNCQKNSQLPCKLYAVDDYVVWKE